MDLDININTVIILLFVVVYFITKSNIYKNNFILKSFTKKANSDIQKRPVRQQEALYNRISEVIQRPSNDLLPLVNIRTQPGELLFRKLGYIYRDENDASYDPSKENRFQLFGRMEYRGKFHYYIMPNGVKMDLAQTKEMFDEDTINISGYSGTWTVRIYENRLYNYIPYF